MSEALPFDVEIERRPPWVDVASGLVVVSALLAAAKLVPMAAVLPFLIASSVGSRFGSSATHVVVDEDGALVLDGKRIPDVRDVWLEDDGVEPRVVAAYGEARELAVLWFENREQARRFAGAFPERQEVVAGYRPRKIDLLSPLRFVAIAVAFFAMGSWYGGLALLFVPLSLRNLLAAKQLVIQGDRFELRTALDAESFPRDGVVTVDVDEGRIVMKGERELRFATPNARDRHLTAPLWTDASRRRALKVLQRRGVAPAPPLA